MHMIEKQFTAGAMPAAFLCKTSSFQRKNQTIQNKTTYFFQFYFTLKPKYCKIRKIEIKAGGVNCADKIQTHFIKAER